MTTASPFPGMDPCFEPRWRDAPTMLIAYLGEALQERLPADLVAEPDQYRRKRQRSLAAG